MIANVEDSKVVSLNAVWWIKAHVSIWVSLIFAVHLLSWKSIGSGDGQRQALSLRSHDFVHILDVCKFPKAFPRSILTNNGSFARFTEYEAVNGKHLPSAFCRWYYIYTLAWAGGILTSQLKLLYSKRRTPLCGISPASSESISQTAQLYASSSRKINPKSKTSLSTSKQAATYSTLIPSPSSVSSSKSKAIPVRNTEPILTKTL